jgi:hypothetical protein
VDRLQPAGIQAVDAPAAGVAHMHQLNLAEHLQVLGDAGLGDPQLLDQLEDRALAGPQHLEDVAALRLGDRVEGVGGRGGSGHADHPIPLSEYVKHDTAVS